MPYPYPMTRFAQIRARYRAVIAEYALAAFLVHNGHAALIIVGAGLLVGCQAGADGCADWTAAAFAGWAAAQALQPPRMALTAVITPVAVRWWRARLS